MKTPRTTDALNVSTGICRDSLWCLFWGKTAVAQASLELLGSTAWPWTHDLSQGLGCRPPPSPCPDAVLKYRTHQLALPRSQTTSLAFFKAQLFITGTHSIKELRKTFLVSHSKAVRPSVHTSILSPHDLCALQHHASALRSAGLLIRSPKYAVIVFNLLLRKFCSISTCPPGPANDATWSTSAFLGRK